jgi:hypothetical protein
VKGVKEVKRCQIEEKGKEKSDLAEEYSIP